MGSGFTDRGFTFDGRCPVCDSKMYMVCGWEHFCLRCKTGRLADATYEAIGLDKPRGSVKGAETLSVEFTVIDVAPEHVAAGLATFAGRYVFLGSLDAAAYEWNDETLRHLVDTLKAIPSADEMLSGSASRNA